MMRSVRRNRPAFTLVEMLLVVGVLAVLMSFLVPNVLDDLERMRLPESARQMRSVLQLTRAHAMCDGRRYRVRWAEPGKGEEGGDIRQPIIEREDEPLREPGVFNPVKAPWVHGATLLDGIRCVEVRLGKPTIERLITDDTKQQEMLVQELGDGVDEVRPPLYFEPDGTSEWVTFVITNAPPEAGDLAEELADYPMIEVILDGLTGLAWLQRPFYDEEIAMLQEHNWPPVLRRDFLEPRVLTENDVIEIRESLVRRK